MPVEQRGVEAPAVEDLAKAVENALRQRPEMRLVGLRRDNAGLLTEYSANQASFQRINELSALAGLPPIPPASFGSLPSFLTGGYGNSRSNLFSGRFPAVSVGLAFDLTF